MVDIHQHGIEPAPWCERVEAIAARRQREEVAGDEAAARIVADGGSERQQAAPVPADDRFQHLDDDERPHVAVVEDRLRRVAEAEAKATEMLSAAIAGGNALSVNYFIAEKYLKALEGLALSPNQKTLILPIEATQILGSLAGIGEIAKAAFGQAGAPPRPPVRGGSVPSAGG